MRFSFISRYYKGNDRAVINSRDDIATSNWLHFQYPKHPSYFWDRSIHRYCGKKIVSDCENVKYIFLIWIITKENDMHYFAAFKVLLYFSDTTLH